MPPQLSEKSTRARRERQTNLLRRLILRLRMWVRTILLLRSDTHAIALGFAIGAYIGIFPTFGLGLIIVSFLAIFLKFNVPAAVIGTAIANPFLGPFWMFLSVKVGGLITGALHINLEAVEKSFLNKVFNVGIDYIVGNLAISTVVSLASYFIVKALVESYHRLRDERRKRHQDAQNSLGCNEPADKKED